VRWACTLLRGTATCTGSPRVYEDLADTLVGSDEGS
jgi:hypothetical protein